MAECKHSVRFTVIAAACVVAGMTIVAGASSWLIYARIEALLVAVADEQSPALAQAIRLAESSNRYAAGGGELEAAHNQIQRQNATVALAQHAHSLQAVIAALRRLRLTAEHTGPIERLVQDLENNLLTQNQQVEERIRLDARARRNLSELSRMQAALDTLLARTALASPDVAEGEAPPRPLETAGTRMLLRLTEAGQIDLPATLLAARADYESAHGRFGAAMTQLQRGSREYLEAQRLLAAIDALATGPDGVFPGREAALGVRAAIAATAAQGREIVTRLGIAVSGLVNAVEAENERTRQAVGAQIDTGRRWLLAVAVVTFLGPLTFVWLVVSRTIVRPLARLAAATRRIADGDLTAPIPPSHHAEFHAIAEALAVFRDNTAALAESSEELSRSEEAQRQAREAAERALADLRETQEQLIQSEKMAALAGVVAGVAHEVNTPLGITLTSASLLSDELDGMAALLAQGALRRADFEEFLGRAREIAQLIQGNMNRAAALVQAFKQVAADQSSERRRVFDLRETIEQTVISVKPACEKAGHAIALDCPPGIEVDSYPGALSQVLTILVMNSLDHAFEPGQHGRMTITAALQDRDRLRIDYCDSGRGLPPSLHRRAFEPFFTTRRAHGNTGLGLHIAFNIVEKSLKGRIDLASDSGGGAHFVLLVPARLPAEEAEEAVV
ncbi:MAG TPA: ATP-binding protein [Azospirillum sp.]